MHPRLSRTHVYHVLLMVTTGLLTMRSLHQLWEQDIFWQVKAGVELFQTWSLPTVESWSYTSGGQPWYNFQWLATLMMAAVFHSGGVAGLVFFRAFLLLTVLSILTLTLKKDAAKLSPAAIWGTIVLVGCALCKRTQIRPDFIMLVPFTFIGLLWRQKTALRTKWVGSFLLVWLSANIHPGCALFALGYGIIEGSLQFSSIKSRIVYALSLVLAWCFTPYIYEIPYYIKRYLFYSSLAPLKNPDFDPIYWDQFFTLEFGLYLQCFGLCSFIAMGTILGNLNRWLQIRNSKEFPEKEILTFLGVLFLTLMSIRHQRVLPYAVTLMAPKITEGLTLFLEYLNRFISRRMEMIFGLLTCLILTIHLFTNQPALGFDMNPSIYPYECLDFIRKNKPFPRLLHELKDGDSVIGFLPEYQDFADTREVPFDHLAPLLKDIYDDPEKMALFLDQHQINTVMLSLSFFLFRARENDPPPMRRLTYFPKASWAVCAFDNQGILLLRRIPEHAALIKRYEYHLVIPDLPPDFYFSAPDSTPETDRIFNDELTRCLSDLPRAEYCRLVQNQALSRSGTKREEHP